jgi:hypothetical protein
MNINNLKEAIKAAIDKVLNESMDVNTEKSFDIILKNGDKIKNVKFFKNGEWYQDTKTGRKVGGKVPEGAKVVNENQPATKPTPRPTEKPGPAVAPGKPGEKPKPRRPLGNPDVKPAPKAMNEEEMLKKIVARFKSKK